MSTFSKDIEQRKEKKARDNARKDKLASYFFDVSKLIIAGVVIGGITPICGQEYNEGNYYLVSVGVITSILFAWIGNKILK